MIRSSGSYRIALQRRIEIQPILDLLERTRETRRQARLLVALRRAGWHRPGRNGVKATD